MQKIKYGLQALGNKVWRLETLLDTTLVLALYASLRHVSFAFSTVNGGNEIESLVSAIAIDGGLVALARGIARQRVKGKQTWPLWLGVALFGLVTTYANWFSGTINQSVISLEPFGIYFGYANSLVDYRAILLSGILPILIFYVTEIRASLEMIKTTIKRPSVDRPLLTARELIDFYLAQGLEPAMIASRVGMRVNSVEEHIAEL